MAILVAAVASEEEGAINIKKTAEILWNTVNVITEMTAIFITRRMLISIIIKISDKEALDKLLIKVWVTREISMVGECNLTNSNIGKRKTNRISIHSS